jgi:glycosidase
MTTATSTAVSTWWRDSVVYQVYVRSFADGNGGGQGDIMDCGPDSATLPRSGSTQSG